MAGEAKNVFITGATGFIGSNLSRFLLKKGYRVNILLRKKSDTSNLDDILHLLIIHKGELSNKNNLKRILEKIKPTYIFHLASYGNSSTQKELNKMIEVNFLGLYNLLDASLGVKYKSFVISGSSSEYGFKNKPMRETDILEPNSYYSATKSAASLLAQSFALENNKPIKILRLFSVYGPFEDKNRLIPTAISKALQNKDIFITKGKIKRDFIYVDDVVEAFYKVMITITKKGEIINIGTGKHYDNKDIAEKIKKIINKKIKIKLGKFPKRSWDTNFWVADVKKAKKILKWAPKNTLNEGLKKTIEWNMKKI